MLKKPDLNKVYFRISPIARKHVEDNECPTCFSAIRDEDFKNEISKREYTISGMCQSCQDKTF